LLSKRQVFLQKQHFFENYLGTTMAAHSAQCEAWATASSDMDLVHASKNGYVAAFEELARRYDRKLLRIAQSVTNNREDSEDVVQEAFLKAFYI
jgi:hypothetical protein